MFKFLLSKQFWLAVSHIAIIGLGAYASYVHGTPLPSVITSGVNALLPTPASPSDPTPTN